MADATSNPAAVRALQLAPAKDGKAVKIGSYVISEQEVAVLYVAESVFKKAAAGDQQYVLKPRLKEGVKEPKDGRYTVADFNVPRNSSNLLFDVHAKLADGTRGRAQAEQFKINYETRRLQHGALYGGPIAEGNTLTIRLDRPSYEGIHWVRKHVEGFEDLFLEDPKLVAKMKADAAPPVQVPDDHSFETLGMNPPEGRPISSDSERSRKALAKAPVITDAEEDRADAKHPLRATRRFWLKITQNQQGTSLELEAPPERNQEICNNIEPLVRLVQLYGARHILDTMPVEQLMPDAAVFQYLQDHDDAELVDPERAIFYATGRLIVPGPNFERCSKRLERLIEFINEGEAIGGDGPANFTLAAEEHAKQIGGTNQTQLQPSRLSKFYRKTTHKELEPILAKVIR